MQHIPNTSYQIVIRSVKHTHTHVNHISVNRSLLQPFNYPIYKYFVLIGPCNLCGYILRTYSQGECVATRSTTTNNTIALIELPSKHWYILCTPKQQGTTQVFVNSVNNSGSFHSNI